VFALQIAPLLLPTGGEELEIGERENVGGVVGQVYSLPLWFGVVTSATAFANPSDFGWLNEVHAGDRLRVAVRYHGADVSAAQLTFSAQYLSNERWRIEGASNESVELAIG
jgi:hypothetical protein